MNEENAVEEVAGISSDEQSAAWREVAREAVSGAIQLGKLYMFYLFLRLGYELAMAWMAL